MRFKKINISSYIKNNEKSPLSNFYINSARRTLALLSSDYPGVGKWFDTKVMPGLSNYTRDILLITYRDEIAALSIFKNDSFEKKICTIRVAPKYQHVGLGSIIVETGMEYLDTRYPLITVPESKVCQFDNLFNKFNFRINDIKNNVYTPGNRECYINLA